MKLKKYLQRPLPAMLVIALILVVLSSVVGPSAKPQTFEIGFLCYDTIDIIFLSLAYLSLVSLYVFALYKKDYPKARKRLFDLACLVVITLAIGCI